MKTSPQPVKRARRKEARPGELLDAALDLFVEKGYAGTRVEEVAKRAGVSKGTLFLYFPSKEELFKAVVRENLSNQFPEWNAELDGYTQSTADLVRYALNQWWQRLGATKLSGIVKLVMTEASHFPEIATFYEQEVIVPGNGLLKRILQRGIDRGEFCPIDLDYGIYALISPLMFLMLWKHSLAPCVARSHDIDPEAFIRTQAEMVLSGLLVRPAPQGVEAAVQ
jgi:AcrR family transcriptional regulator